MSITSFDHFIETLEPVPPELQRIFNIIAELDKKTSENIKRIDECVREYRAASKKETRILLYRESMDLLDKARSYADDKIDLAAQTYDLIDKHIRCLESLSGAQNVLQTKDPESAGDQKVNKKKLKSGGYETPESSACTPRPFTVDMPPDPNEPKYCTCQQVSYGEMIACDNKDCPTEWFHFPCVDLKSKPKGRWYCPECYNANKKWKQRK